MLTAHAYLIRRDLTIIYHRQFLSFGHPQPPTLSLSPTIVSPTLTYSLAHLPTRVMSARRQNSASLFASWLVILRCVFVSSCISFKFWACAFLLPRAYFTPAHSSCKSLTRHTMRRPIAVLLCLPYSLKHCPYFTCALLSIIRHACTSCIDTGCYNNHHITNCTLFREKDVTTKLVVHYKLCYITTMHW